MDRGMSRVSRNGSRNRLYAIYWSAYVVIVRRYSVEIHYKSVDHFRVGKGMRSDAVDDRNTK